MLRLQLQGRRSRCCMPVSGSSAADAADWRRGTGRAGAAAAAAAAAMAAARMGGGGCSAASCSRLARAGCWWLCSCRWSGCCCCACCAAMPEWPGSSPLRRPLRVAAAAPSAGSNTALATGAPEAAAVAGSAAAAALPWMLWLATAFRLASTSAASGVLAGKPPGVAAGGLMAVTGPAAGVRRCSNGVAGTPAACSQSRDKENTGHRSENVLRKLCGCADVLNGIALRGGSSPLGRQHPTQLVLSLLLHHGGLQEGIKGLVDGQHAGTTPG